MKKVTWDDIYNLLGSIKADSCEIEDNEIVKMVENWTPSYNCEAAADGFLKVIPLIISVRPNIERALLKIAIRPMFYMGITETKQVSAWVESFLKNERKNLSEECISWFKRELVEEKEGVIAEILQEIQNEEV